MSIIRINSILAAIVCFIFSKVLENNGSSTNMLYVVLSISWTPLLYLSTFSWIKTVSLSGGLLNFTLSMIPICFSKRSLLEDKKCAKWTRALAKGSKLLGLVPAPNVSPMLHIKYCLL